MNIEGAVPSTTNSQENASKHRENGTGEKNKPEAKETRDTKENTRSSSAFFKTS